MYVMIHSFQILCNRGTSGKVLILVFRSIQPVFLGLASSLAGSVCASRIGLIVRCDFCFDHMLPL